jgi:Ca2+-binding RTX toxin-like protein
MIPAKDVILGRAVNALSLRGGGGDDLIVGSKFSDVIEMGSGSNRVSGGEGIDEFIGDAVLAVFGAPLSRDDDARRALRCALSMQHALDAVNDAIDEAEIALSIDLDVFAAAFAPGVSAPNAMGIAPDAAFRRVLRGLIASERVRGVEIAELCPALDVDDRTARLGAAIVFEIASTLGDGDEDGDQDNVEGGDEAESEFRDDDAMGSDGDR